MSQRIFLVDTEATGPSPYSSVMTEFGVVDFATRATFHGVLWDSMPSPENPAIPVLGSGPGPRYQTDTDPKPVLITREHSYTDAHRARVYTALTDWLTGFGGRPIFVSDNPGFDWQWISYGFDQAGLANPFGHSSRRIGDLAAGLSGNWRRTSDWKRFRRTKHDHNPVNDSLGNAEALATLLSRHDQKV